MIVNSSTPVYSKIILVQQIDPESRYGQYNWAIKFPNIDGEIIKESYCLTIREVIEDIYATCKVNPFYRGFFVKVESLEFEEQYFNIFNDSQRVQIILRYQL